MALGKAVMARLRAFFRPSAVERELDEEIRFHLERETEANLRRGLPPAEARRRALIAFGGVQAVKEEHRDGRGRSAILDLIKDLRLAFRGLRRAPAITAAAVATLALAIGADTAVFSVVNAVVLRPLPFPDPGRLVMLSEDNPEKGWRHNSVAPANFLDWRERVAAFQDVAGYAETGQVTLDAGGPPRRAGAAIVTGTFFAVLGARPERGRFFDSSETWLGGRDIAVISHGLWQREFAGGPIDGRTVLINGRRIRIIGVAPPDFSFPRTTVDVWRPTAWDPADRGREWFRRAHWLRVVARLRPGVSLEAADGEFQVVVSQLQREFPATNRMMGADLMPLHDFLVADVRRPLLILQAAVTVLLLLGCANVGNLLLVQAAGREREAALRLLLGAGPGRLVRLALTESLALAVLGGIAGIGLAFLGTTALTHLVPAGMLPLERIRVDGRILGYGFGIAMVSGLLFGLAPLAWNSRRAPVEVVQRGGTRATDGRRARRLGNALAVAEVALALLLGVGAGLLVRSLQRLARVDPGFDPAGVLTVGVDLPEIRYDSSARIVSFYQHLLERIRALPGVELAATSLLPPLSGVAWTGDFHLEGRPADDYGTEVAHESVSPDYFRALRIPILSGRPFGAADRDGSPPVVIVNQALVAKYFGRENPIGRRLVFRRTVDSTAVWRTIVGVVGNVHQTSLGLEPQIQVFAPAAQEVNSYRTLLVRGANPAALEPAVRAVVAELDPTLAPSPGRTMESIRAGSVARERFLMTLLLTFAFTGLALAVVGVYGVMEELARRQVRDMGIRIALGAQAGQVQWMIVRQGLGLAAAGVAAGGLAAMALTGAMRGMLFEIQPSDPATFGSVTALLAGAALLASWIPSVRASRADPMTALRTD